MANKKGTQYIIWADRYNLDLREVQSMDAKARNIGISFEEFMEVISIFGGLSSGVRELIKKYGVEELKAHKDIIEDCNSEELTALVENGYETGYEMVKFLRKKDEEERIAFKNKKETIRKELLQLCEKYGCKLYSEDSDLREKVEENVHGYEYEIDDIISFAFIVDF